MPFKHNPQKSFHGMGDFFGVPVGDGARRLLLQPNPGAIRDRGPFGFVKFNQPGTIARKSITPRTCARNLHAIG
jgi:hypothetical protein